MDGLTKVLKLVEQDQLPAFLNTIYASIQYRARANTISVFRTRIRKPRTHIAAKAAADTGLVVDTSLLWIRGNRNPRDAGLRATKISEREALAYCFLVAL